MRLELKHLAPYLPYRLMVQYKPHFSDDFKIKELCTTSVAFSLHKQDKPILRPLSDLTKEIEVNGEKFVPIEEFEKAGYIFPLNEDNFHNLPFGIVNILLKWHFDIYGLIENDLAIDINTL